MQLWKSTRTRITAAIRSAIFPAEPEPDDESDEATALGGTVPVLLILFSQAESAPGRLLYLSVQFLPSK
jgi:hypothetical protein